MEEKDAESEWGEGNWMEINIGDYRFVRLDMFLWKKENVEKEKE